MEKNLPFELDREILIQLAPEQLVEIIVEQASATIKLNSRILELEQEIGKLKASRDLDSKTSSKPPSGTSSKNPKKNLRTLMVKAKLQNENREENQGIREKLVKGLVE
jgi:transposase